MPKEEGKQLLQLNPIKTRLLKIDVESYPESTYIQHRLNTDTVDDFTKREFGKSDKKKIRDLDKEYESCFFYTENKKHGVPVAAFISAILDSCVALNIPKTKVKRAIRLLGDIVEIKYKKINRRKDTVRRGGINKTPDIRHRPEFVEWSCQLLIQFDEEQVTPEQVINLVNYAGFTSGIGDWRPSAPKSTGTHGMFKVKSK